MRDGRRNAVLILGAGLIPALAFGFWLWQEPDEFRPPGNRARFFHRISTLCGRLGVPALALTFSDRAEKAKEEHLRRAVKAGVLAHIIYPPPTNITFAAFCLQLVNHAAQRRIALFVVRNAPAPNRPTGYEIFAEKSAERILEEYLRTAEWRDSSTSARSSRLEFDRFETRSTPEY
jgi:hypothetical protein